MATIQKRGNSYSIRVSCGYDTQGKQVIQSKTWTPDEGMTERQIQKELERQKVLFEEECKKGFQSKSVKFETLCNEWFEEYAKNNLRHTTYSYLYHQRLRINKAIGHMRMDKIATRQIQAFINSLSKEGANEINGKPLSPKSIRHKKLVFEYIDAFYNTVRIHSHCDYYSPNDFENLYNSSLHSILDFVG